MRTFLHFSSILTLCLARTLLVETKDMAKSESNGDGKLMPISIYSEYEDNEDSDHVPEEGKGTNRKLLIDIEKMIRENWEALKKTS